MDLSITSEKTVFNVRSAAVILHNDSILFSTHEGIPYLYLPGGRVQLMENSEDACVREVKEELGVTCRIERLLWIAESFFLEETSQKHFHELCFYYLVTLDEASDCMKQSVFEVKEHTITHTYKWLNVNDVDQAKIKPEFLHTHLQALPLSPVHLIVHE